MTGNGQSSINQIQDRIIDELAHLDDRLEKYEYLIGLGRDFFVPDGGIRSDENAVAGCQARVWIKAEMREGRLRLVADSDAMITRGLISLLLRVFDDQPPQDILDAELYFLDRTGLGTHLSPSRANGLTSMVRQILSYAEEQASRARD
jgi:cysteine desulfuration protein SufE